MIGRRGGSAHFSSGSAAPFSPLLSARRGGGSGGGFWGAGGSPEPRPVGSRTMAALPPREFAAQVLPGCVIPTARQGLAQLWPLLLLCLGARLLHRLREWDLGDGAL